MRAKISALMDGELDGAEFATSLAALSKRDPTAYEAWCVYHLVSDALGGTRALSEGFSARLAQRLDHEPTVLAPAAPATQPARRHWIAYSAAASLAAAALVGWLAFAPQHAASPVPGQLAQATRPATAPAPLALARTPAQVPLPREADDYVLAHQSYSLRSSLQGIMPYVRTVSVENLSGKP